MMIERTIITSAFSTFGFNYFYGKYTNNASALLCLTLIWNRGLHHNHPQDPCKLFLSPLVSNLGLQLLHLHQLHPFQRHLWFRPHLLSELHKFVQWSPRRRSANTISPSVFLLIHIRAEKVY